MEQKKREFEEMFRNPREDLMIGVTPICLSNFS